MPSKERTPAPLPSPELMLAALDRAIRHRSNQDTPGVGHERVKRHLRIPHNGATTIRLRPVWEQLKADGLVETIRSRGNDCLNLTAKGHKHLAAAQDAVGLYELPESPQHERWREAHAAATERIEGFRTNLRLALTEAVALLDRTITSEEWYEQGNRLKRCCSRLASATYVLAEWDEPDDAVADIDDPPYGQNGRREISRWDSRWDS